MQFSHVLLQVKVPTESFGADLARVRFFIVVRVHVEGEIVDLMEGFVADIAFVRLVAAVRQLVVLVIALLVETLAAVLAHERFVARMNPGVGVQRGRPIEGLAARMTLVRFLGRVDDLVATESARLSKSLAADLAHKGPSTRVNGHVTGQVVMRIEHLSTLLAGECLLFASGASASKATHSRCSIVMMMMVH